MMKREHVIDLLPEYLDMVLDESQNIKIEDHLNNCNLCKNYLKDLKILFSDFDNEVISAPSEQIKSRFYQMLETEKDKIYEARSINTRASNIQKFLLPVLKIAAIIALIVGAYFLGVYHQNLDANKSQRVAVKEINKTNEKALFSLMGNKSASKRIQGVSLVTKISDPDNAIINAVIDRMLYDKTVNVRLAAVEVLNTYLRVDSVKLAFIDALKKERNPSIQISIIRSLVKTHGKEAKPSLEKLLNKKDTRAIVKEQIKLLFPNTI